MVLGEGNRWITRSSKSTIRASRKTSTIGDLANLHGFKSRMVSLELAGQCRILRCEHARPGRAFISGRANPRHHPEKGDRFSRPDAPNLIPEARAGVLVDLYWQNMERHHELEDLAWRLNLPVWTLIAGAAWTFFSTQTHLGRASPVLVTAALFHGIGPIGIEAPRLLSENMTFREHDIQRT